MDYAIAFAAAKPLLARSEADQWELARITFEVVETHGRGILTRWAADLGISLSHASNLRKVWAIFGDVYRGKETDRTFSEYLTLARSSPERRRDLIEGAERSGRKVNSEDRAHRRRLHSTREFLRDRRHALELLEDPEVERTMDRALRERRRAHDHGNLTDRQIPGGEQLAFDFGEELTEVGERLDAVLGHVGETEVPNAERRELVAQVIDLEARLRTLRGVLQPNRRTRDAEPGDPVPTPRRRSVPPPPDPDPAPVVEVVPDQAESRPRRGADRPHRRDSESRPRRQAG